nr:hypothetical protein CJLB15_00002 [Campylobacter phage CJLB-15]
MNFPINCDKFLYNFESNIMIVNIFSKNNPYSGAMI